MGEAGRLSPDDRERLRDERLRLVWSRLDCLVIFLNKELRFLLKSTKKNSTDIKRFHDEEEAEEQARCVSGTHSCPSLVPVLLLRRAILDL